MQIWLIKYLPHILIVVIAVGAFLWGQHAWNGYKADLVQSGYDRAMADVKIAQEQANEKLRQKKKVIKHETPYDRDLIVRELCTNNWVRNPEHCPK